MRTGWAARWPPTHGDGIKLAVLAGVDSIEHGSYIDDEGIKLMKEHKTWLVPTLYLGDWLIVTPKPSSRRRRCWPRPRWCCRRQAEHCRAIKAGVPIAFGTDAAVYPHGLNGASLPCW
jgi:imidazolonepropionase-like amidohydrolase